MNPLLNTCTVYDFQHKCWEWEGLNVEEIGWVDFGVDVHPIWGPSQALSKCMDQSGLAPVTFAVHVQVDTLRLLGMTPGKKGPLSQGRESSQKSSRGNSIAMLALLQCSPEILFTLDYKSRLVRGRGWLVIFKIIFIISWDTETINFFRAPIFFKQLTRHSILLMNEPTSPVVLPVSNCNDTTTDHLQHTSVQWYPNW